MIDRKEKFLEVLRTSRFEKACWLSGMTQTEIMHWAQQDDQFWARMVAILDSRVRE